MNTIATAGRRKDIKSMTEQKIQELLKEAREKLHIEEMFNVFQNLQKDLTLLNDYDETPIIKKVRTRKLVELSTIKSDWRMKLYFQYEESLRQ